MKKQIFTTELLLVLCFLSVFSAFAQTHTLKLNPLGGTPPHNKVCKIGAKYGLNLFLNYGNYGTGDTIFFRCESTFGAGSVTNCLTDQYGFTIATFLFTPEKYDFLYDVKCIAYDKKGYKDSIILYSALLVKDTCFTVSGQAFVDFNGNCTFDSTDKSLHGYPIFYSTSMGNYVNTDVNGQYKLLLPNKPTNLTVTDMFFKDNCLTDADYTISLVSDTTNIDFHVKPKQISLGYIGYTNKTYCGTPAKSQIKVPFRYVGFKDSTSTTAKILFGDGKDTTVVLNVWSPNKWGSASPQYNHIFYIEGVYSPTAICINPFDSTSVSMSYPNSITVQDSCVSITGSAYFDINQNCLLDSNDNGAINQKINLINNTTRIDQTFTDINGKYKFSVPIDSIYSKNYKIRFVNEGKYSVCPADSEYILTSLPANNKNFAIICKQGYDLTGSVSGWGFRPGFKGYIYVNAENRRCESVNATIKFVKSPILSILSTYPPADATSGDTLIWYRNNFGNQDKFFTNIDVETDPNAFLDSTLRVKLLIDPIADDAVQKNNRLAFNFPIKNSWDPNMKLASVNGDATNSAIAPDTKEIDYTIFFQNTGNAEAINISVMDTLDKSIDPTSVEILSSSHAMTANILQGNIIKFTFKNILLLDSTTNEPASHGFVSYKVYLKEALPIGTNIKNTAFIYFDFNPAVVTNTTENVLTNPTGVAKRAKISNIQAYPNPANTELNLMLPQEAQGGVLSIIDILGNVVSKTIVNNGLLKLKTADLPNGMYLLQLNKGNIVYKGKIAIVH